MERDEVYVPKTREDLGIPDFPSHEIDWDEVFGDTPIYTFLMLIRQQLLAFPAYLREFMFAKSSGGTISLSPTLLRQALLTVSAHSLSVYNVSGQKAYPKWTNHFSRTFL
jgi:omega-6 fatty acid desaturase (delta-12 desaturase)